MGWFNANYADHVDKQTNSCGIKRDHSIITLQTIIIHIRIHT